MVLNLIRNIVFDTTLLALPLLCPVPLVLLKYVLSG